MHDNGDVWVFFNFLSIEQEIRLILDRIQVLHSTISNNVTIWFPFNYLSGYISLCLNFFHLLARKPNLELFSIYSNKFFHNFHLSESSFTYANLRTSG